MDIIETEQRNKFINGLIEYLNKHREDLSLRINVESTEVEELGHCFDGTVYGKNSYIITIEANNFYEKTDDFSFVWKKIG